MNNSGVQCGRSCMHGSGLSSVSASAVTFARKMIIIKNNSAPNQVDDLMCGKKNKNNLFGLLNAYCSARDYSII